MIFFRFSDVKNKLRTYQFSAIHEGNNVKQYINIAQKRLYFIERGRLTFTTDVSRDERGRDEK